ncbi:MAG: hypothetical protein U0838_05880 [Chloroflexota bacterium]
MELLVATWTTRLALVGALLVGWISLAAGATMLEVAMRIALAAFVLTTAGLMLMGWLETPEQKMLRLRAGRSRKRSKKKAKK